MLANMAMLRETLSYRAFQLVFQAPLYIRHTERKIIPINA